MNKILKKIGFLSLVVIGVASCNKDEENTEIKPIIPIVYITVVDTTIPTNVICDGNGSNSYYPMEITDTWTYRFKMAGITQSPSPKITNLGLVNYNSSSYNVFNDETGSMYLSSNYFRKDSLTQDIIFYDDDNNVEYLFVPANPGLNQTWDYGGTTGMNTRKVTNLSATLTTDFCTYTDLLEISQYRDNGDLTIKNYFKKGVGLVQKSYFNNFFNSFDTYTLISVTLH